jgi:peroxidase
MAGFASFSCVLLILLVASYACASEVELDYSSIPIEAGLSWDFHDSSCPKLESIIRKELKKIFKKDIGQAAGLLRVHFHDCFVQVTTPFWFWELYIFFYKPILIRFIYM